MELSITQLETIAKAEKKTISNSYYQNIYDEICDTLTWFHSDEPELTELTDGEMLDEFYLLAAKIKYVIEMENHK